jgi:hypothetical protein
MDWIKTNWIGVAIIVVAIGLMVLSPANTRIAAVIFFLGLASLILAMSRGRVRP